MAWSLAARWRAVAFLALWPLAVGLPEGSAGAQDADMDKIFRCDVADGAARDACRHDRDLIVLNCTPCHSWVRIVRKQASRELWASTVNRMRVNMPDLRDADAETILSFVVANFREDLPQPEIPDSLMEAEYPMSTAHKHAAN